MFEPTRNALVYGYDSVKTMIFGEFCSLGFHIVFEIFFLIIYCVYFVDYDNIACRTLEGGGDIISTVRILSISSTGWD